MQENLIVYVPIIINQSIEHTLVSHHPSTPNHSCPYHPPFYFSFRPAYTRPSIEIAINKM
ncbi:hypothetical protein Fmac_010888 [Flemingia macrophylla]|uniref:Uncharacterized protein n=1 Tax=Flemingia macrophylla TaxID=520843 RepID=A0ABD1MKW7_9FABA